MRKSAFVLALAAFLLIGAMTAVAQVRFDVDIPWLLAIGTEISDITGDMSTDDMVDVSRLHIPLPYLELAYEFGRGSIRGGVGIRTYTMLVQFFGWPMGYVEFDLDPIVIRAELGGFAFILFGLYNDVFVDEYTLRVLVPDINVSWQITPWFRAGVGATLISPMGSFENFGYIIYVDGRFVFRGHRNSR